MHMINKHMSMHNFKANSQVLSTNVLFIFLKKSCLTYLEIFQYFTNFLYHLPAKTTRNQPQPPKTSYNHQKPSKTTQHHAKLPQTTPNHPNSPINAWNV